MQDLREQSWNRGVEGEVSPDSAAMERKRRRATGRARCRAEPQTGQMKRRPRRADGAAGVARTGARGDGSGAGTVGDGAWGATGGPRL